MNQMKQNTVLRQRNNQLFIDNGKVHINDFTLWHEGKGDVILGPKEKLLAQILLLNVGETVTYSEMMDWLYVQHNEDDVEPETARHSLDVTLLRMREKFERIGVLLVNWHSVGYRMMIA